MFISFKNSFPLGRVGIANICRDLNNKVVAFVAQIIKKKKYKYGEVTLYIVNTLKNVRLWRDFMVNFNVLVKTTVFYVLNLTFLCFCVVKVVVFTCQKSKHLCQNVLSSIVDLYCYSFYFIYIAIIYISQNLQPLGRFNI